MPDPTVGSAGMRLVRLLAGNPPRAVQDLCEETGITRTAITEQLSELVAAGYVRRFLERRPHRGRPRYVYSASDTALANLFDGNQNLIVPALWKAVGEIGGTQLKDRVLQSVSHALAEHYGPQVKGKTPESRLRDVARVLRETEGNEVEIEKDDQGRLLMRRRSCSFFSMFEPTGSVCRLDEQMLSKIVGAPVRRTACRHDGAPCCVFQIDVAD